MSFAIYGPNGFIEHVPAAVDAQGRSYTSGHDFIEGVTKVALMVWNTDLLTWERGTSTGGGGGGGGSTTTTKRIDIVSPLLTYTGDAAVGTAEASVGWLVKKLTFDASGNVTSVLVGSGSWVNRAALSFG